jgi:hypothetical protein
MSVKEQWPVGIRADQDLHGPVDANALLVQSGQLLQRPGNGGIDIDTTCPTLDTHSHHGDTRLRASSCDHSEKSRSDQRTLGASGYSSRNMCVKYSS